MLFLSCFFVIRLSHLFCKMHLHLVRLSECVKGMVANTYLQYVDIYLLFNINYSKVDLPSFVHTNAMLVIIIGISTFI